MINEPKEKTAGEIAVETAAAPVNDKAKSFKEICVQMCKFTFFSLGAGIIQLLSFALLNEVIFVEQYWLSYIIALALSVLYNFTVNRRFTFKSAANIPIAMLLVILFYGAFTPYSTWLTDYLADKQGWNEYLVLLIVMVQNLILEFLWCRFVVYRKNINTAVKGKNPDDINAVK